eukprot:8170045-Pyramimonas_sp.AAC.1
MLSSDQDILRRRLSLLPRPLLFPCPMAPPRVPPGLELDNEEGGRLQDLDQEFQHEHDLPPDDL